MDRLTMRQSMPPSPTTPSSQLFRQPAARPTCSVKSTRWTIRTAANLVEIFGLVSCFAQIADSPSQIVPAGVRPVPLQWQTAHPELSSPSAPAASIRLTLPSTPAASHWRASLPSTLRSYFSSPITSIPRAAMIRSLAAFNLPCSTPRPNAINRRRSSIISSIASWP